MFDEMDGSGKDDELASLFRRAFGGERAVFKQLVDALTPLIQSIVVARGELGGQSSSWVPDAVQDVLIDMLFTDTRWFFAWRPQRGRLGGFIYGVARRRVRDVVRKNWRERRCILDDSIAERIAHPAPSAERRAEAREQLEHLVECDRTSLTPRQSETFARLLSDVLGWPEEAEDAPASARGRNQGYQARRRLRQALQGSWLARCSEIVWLSRGLGGEDGGLPSGEG